MAINKKELFDKNASLFVLSCLMRHPLLLQDDKYAFAKTDFDTPLHQMVFYAIFNMAQEGVEKISPQDVDMYLKQYSAQYEFYKQNKGYEFVLQCFQTTEGTDEKQFESYYNRLKKFSMLRDLEAIGIDTTQFYDTQKDALNMDFEDEKLNKMSLGSIPEVIRQRLVEIESRHIGKDTGTSQNIKKNLRELISSYKETPEVGLPIDGDIINYAVRGARLGKMYIYSAPSGGGKTRYMVGNACAISLPYIDNEGKVVLREDYKKTLFVATEMEADEIQTLVTAYVSGVNEEKIILGNYTLEEEKRVEMAMDIIDKYGDNFIVECIPDPSIALVKARLAKYIIQENVDYIFYDYIFSSPALLGEFRDVAVREDVALMMLSNSLKETAMIYKVFIQSATQLNDGWSKREIGLRDQNCLRGSKAIADKIDVGLIGVRLSEEEHKQIDAIWKELQFQNPDKFKGLQPNIVVDVYKNRRGKLNFVKVLRWFDFGTCRSVDLFVVDASYKAIGEIGVFQYEKRKMDFLDLKTRGEL